MIPVHNYIYFLFRPILNICLESRSRGSKNFFHAQLNIQVFKAKKNHRKITKKKTPKNILYFSTLVLQTVEISTAHKTKILKYFFFVIFLCIKHLDVVFIWPINRIQHGRFYNLQAGMDITLLYSYCVCQQ